ncbi:MAG: hypothetical protein IJS28_02675 [Synergistaceae bacterium]|nr:hypothetical protein [Synergistaceae bacterium]
MIMRLNLKVRIAIFVLTVLAIVGLIVLIVKLIQDWGERKKAEGIEIGRREAEESRGHKNILSWFRRKNEHWG